MEKLVCEYCGREKEEFSFVIGASPKPDWCMIEGTGKIACPNCYVKASDEGQKVIDNHIKIFNLNTKKRW
jgi:sarcosine oxidase delta subunit